MKNYLWLRLRFPLALASIATRRAVAALVLLFAFLLQM